MGFSLFGVSRICSVVEAIVIVVVNLNVIRFSPVPRLIA